MRKFLFLYSLTISIFYCECNKTNNTFTVTYPCLKKLGLRKTTTTLRSKDCVSVTLLEGFAYTCRKGLVHFPAKVPTKTVSFLYTHSRIRNDSLTRALIRILSDIKSLDLTSNMIQTISQDTFTDLLNLEKLYLDQNPIANVNNHGSLVNLPVALEVLSLRNIMHKNGMTEYLWKLFSTNNLDNYKNNLTTTTNTTISTLTSGVTFSMLGNLRVLNLDINNLKYVDVKHLLGTHLLTNLEILTLSKNSLKGDDLTILLKSESAFEERTFQIDLTYNLVEVIDENTLAFLNTSNSANNTTSPVLQNPTSFKKYTIYLKGNPIDCSCRANSFFTYLFEYGGIEIFLDWPSWICHKPLDLLGLFLPDLKRLRIYICFSEWGGKTFSFTSAQMAFIVICGTILSFVSLAVCYLNRRKLMIYYKILRNCGEDADYQNSVMYRGGNTINKYSIPNDHKGVGHRGYYEEENAHMADDDD